MSDVGRMPKEYDPSGASIPGRRTVFPSAPGSSAPFGDRTHRLSELHRVSLRDPGESALPGAVAEVTVTKGGGLELSGHELDGSRGIPAALLSQLYQFAPLIPNPSGEPRELVVYPFVPGVIANATTQDNNVKIPTDAEIAAFAFGQFLRTTGAYVKNNTRWDFYRNTNWHLASLPIANTDLVKGMSDAWEGVALDRHFPLSPPWPVVGGQSLGLLLRNEGTSTLWHDAAAYALIDPGAAYQPIPPGVYDLLVGVIRLATGDFSGSLAGRQFSFQQESGAWVLGFVGHPEGANGAITHQASQIKIGYIDGGTERRVVGGSDLYVTDQLLFGANGQRPLILPTPHYVGRNGGINLDVNNANILSTPANLAYELTVVYLARRMS